MNATFRLCFSVVLLALSSPVFSQTQPEDESAWLLPLMCEASQQSIDLNAPPGMVRAGIDAANSRHLPAGAAGLTRADLGNLELAWALGLPRTSNLRSAPVIIGDTLFFAATDVRTVLALDLHSGCAKWAYQATAALRSSLSYGVIDGVGTLVIGDGAGQVHTIEAETGTVRWIANAQGTDNRGMITGSPLIHDDLIIVPVSGSGVLTGGNPNYGCCENHGAVTALDAATGTLRWEYHTMPPAQLNGLTNGNGVPMKGPSGAPIWTTPTVDVARGQVYVTTGENTSHPTTGTSDAIIALDLATGAERWVFQALANDMWNYSCAGAQPGPNCVLLEDTVSVDHDFGGPAVLVNDGTRDLLVAGQKSGDLWALDPATGALVWHQRVGDGSALGGNHWGIAVDGRRAFLTISDPLMGGRNRSESGVHSFFINSGEASWSYRAQPDCNDGRAERLQGCAIRYGFSATPLVVDGGLVTAGLDGRLYIFDSESGDLLFQYDTAVDFETLNGIPAKGGSIDAHAIAAGNGMLIIGSGYGQFSQTPGNVLLAFKVRD